MNNYRKVVALLPTLLLGFAIMSTATSAEIRTAGTWLKDAQGRTLLLRGTSVGGSSKVPASPDGATHLREGFFEHRNVSFVGRPFPLAEADEHFARLKDWGLTLVRLVVPWEAIEHAGPGQYDKEHLQYLHDLIAKADKHGLQIIIGPHQDAWSRWTGGSGAPGWTLEVVGMDLRQLHPTGAVLAHQFHQGPYSDTDWVGNYNRYGAAAMFTLFFGGNDFAPQLKVGATPVQEYLQSHFLEAFRQVALAVKDLPNVVGFGTLNEPGRGYIGLDNLTQIASSLFLTGASPTPFQGMLIASGYSQEVTAMDSGAKPTGKIVLNPARTNLWREGFAEIWKQHGVWSDQDGKPVLLRPNYFSEQRGRRVDFVSDYLVPFINRYSATIRSVLPQSLIFVESVAAGNDVQMKMALPESQRVGMVFAPKWYDGPTKASRLFYPWLDDAGRDGIKQNFIGQLAELKSSAAKNMAGMPVLISEFGMPMNLEGGKAFKTGNDTVQQDAFNSYFSAMEANLLNAAIWNYTSDNTHAHGDQWNTEDYSIFSRDSKQSGGGRALQAIARPYPMRTAGEPLRLRFDYKTRVFEYEFRPDHHIQMPTEIFMPKLQYPCAYNIKVEGGRYEEDRAHQQLRIKADPGASLVRLRIEPHD